MISKILMVLPVGEVMDTLTVMKVQSQHLDVMRFGRMYMWSDVTDREDAYNLGVACAQENDIEMILFWHGVEPYMTNALQYCADLLMDNDQVSFASWSESFEEDAHRVFSADVGFLLARTAAFAKLDADEYEVKGLMVKRYFTEDDQELGDKCKAADVRWYVHGGAVCVREEAA